MNPKYFIRICQRYNEYCQGCPFVNQHGACTIGQPWKQAEIIHRLYEVTTGKRSEQGNKGDDRRV